MWQMVHGVFALMNICLIADLFAMRLPQRQSCQQMVRSVCTHEHLPDRCSLHALATAPVMSADGSWVFALMNI
jgi:hypothetical protein